MAMYVLVHGAFCGGWLFKDLASHLRKAGHETYAPTLTGLGERSHLAHPDIDLNTHIQDVVNVLNYEDLYDVILVGASYGGIVITGVADQVPERLRHLVYIDAIIPEDGKSVLDIAPPNNFLELARLYGDGWRVPHRGATRDPRTVGQPLKTFQQPITLRNPDRNHLPRTYIHCTEAFNPFAERAKREGWRYQRFNGPHAAVFTHNKEIAGLLQEVAEYDHDRTPGRNTPDH